jgi:hypothetical protein
VPLPAAFPTFCLLCSLSVCARNTAHSRLVPCRHHHSGMKASTHARTPSTNAWHSLPAVCTSAPDMCAHNSGGPQLVQSPCHRRAGAWNDKRTLHRLKLPQHERLHLWLSPCPSGCHCNVQCHIQHPAPQGRKKRNVRPPQVNEGQKNYSLRDVQQLDQRLLQEERHAQCFGR